jgi:TRAP-type mannitol/chloroaromatic compound transport system permease large subunit
LRLEPCLRYLRQAFALVVYLSLKALSFDGDDLRPAGLRQHIRNALYPFKASDHQLFNGVWPFVGASLIALIIIMVFPTLVTFLPEISFK